MRIIIRDVDPQKNIEGTHPLHPLPPFPSHPLRSRPINPARGLGERCNLPRRVWGGAPAEIEFGAF